jgi:hypothetical protein
MSRGHLARLVGSVAAVGAGMLVGTVSAIGMVVSADLDAVDRTVNFQLTWSSGIGFWLVLAAGVTGAAGGILALLATHTRQREPAPPPSVRPSPHPRAPETTASSSEPDTT